MSYSGSQDCVGHSGPFRVVVARCLRPPTSVRRVLRRHTTAPLVAPVDPPCFTTGRLNRTRNSEIRQDRPANLIYFLPQPDRRGRRSSRCGRRSASSSLSRRLARRRQAVLHARATGRLYLGGKPTFSTCV